MSEYASLPPPAKDQAYCDVSALEAGLLTVNLQMFIEGAESKMYLCPTLAFLLKHSKTGDPFVFDLGLHRDLDHCAPTILALLKIFPASVPQDVAQSLEKGGLNPADVKTIAISHCHFDHTGDPSPYTNATFILGAESAHHLIPGYPADPASEYMGDLFPADRTSFLTPAQWGPVGPFPRALDFYGDGSLYIVDAPGHLPGHINVLARTSADGGWVYLAGDSAHHWSLITGEGRVAVGFMGNPLACMHKDKAVAEDHIARIRALWKTPRVRVMLAHDELWYSENKGGPAFWPGHIESL